MVKQAEKTAERSDSSCKFKGVRKRKWGKWVAEIRLPNSRERIWLGSYDSAEKAARAFDAAMFCLRGRNAKFNFPDNPPEIDGGRSLSPPEIQAAAARFANSEPSSEPPKNQSQSQSDNYLTDQSTSELQAESPCASVASDGTVQLDVSELMWDGPYLDLLAGAGTSTGTGTGTDSGNYAADYGIFPGFDDLHNDFFPPPSSHEPSFDYGYNFDGLNQDSFLWNF